MKFEIFKNTYFEEQRTTASDRCFPENIAKFLRTPIYKTPAQLLLKLYGELTSFNIYHL